MVTRRARRGRAAGGFTLVEVLISIGVSLVTLAGLSACMLTALSGAIFSRSLTEASTLAQSAVEELVPLVGVTAINPPDGSAQETDLSALGEAGGPYRRTTTWSLSADGTMRVITVVVSWTDAAGRDHSVTVRREREL